MIYSGPGKIKAWDVHVELTENQLQITSVDPVSAVLYAPYVDTVDTPVGSYLVPGFSYIVSYIRNGDMLTAVGPTKKLKAK